MKTYRLSARIDEDTHRKLLERARIEGKDESVVVRDALSSHLSKETESAYDVLQRIGGIGAAKGLPSNLSTDKKHFEGFGRSDRTRSPRHWSARRATRK